MASVAPGLGLGAPLEDPHRLEEFAMEVPFGKMKETLSSQR